MTVKIGDTVMVSFEATVTRLGYSGVGDAAYVYTTTADGDKLWLTPKQYQLIEEESHG